MALQQLVEQTVTGLGYELVEIERLASGLLRITIDLPWDKGVAEVPGQQRFVTVEDCEKVTRQLLFALEVDAIEYQRLEVSSPGIDRLLRSERDLERFLGHEVDITLKAPIGAAALGQVNANRKKFRGTLERAPGADAAALCWQLVWSDAPKAKPGQRVSKHRAPAPMQVLGFGLDEVREMRLASVVNFKGRGAATDSDDG